MLEDTHFSHFHRQNVSREEWKALRDLVENKRGVFKNADKTSCVVIWDREDYLKEGDRQLSDNKIYTNFRYAKNMLSSLVDKTFQSLSKKKYISEKKLKYFIYKNKSGINLGKLYFLLKIQKCLFNVPGRPVITNCETPTE